MIKVLMCYFRCLGTCCVILTRFDPRYSEGKKTPTDAQIIVLLLLLLLLLLQRRGGRIGGKKLYNVNSLFAN